MARRISPVLDGKPYMKLPLIDLSLLPDLNTLTGVFGSMLTRQPGPGHDDSIVVLATYVFESTGGNII